ncbi:MAG: IS5 family transposase [Planctomycetota bacterium]
MGRSRGGFGSKLHLLTCGEGVVLAATLTAGQAHASKQLEPLLDRVKVGRRQRGRAVACDRAYDTPACRPAIRRRGMRGVIPAKRLAPGKRRRRRGRPPKFDRRLYPRRNVVERTIGSLKRFRRLATRYEKLAVNFMAFVQLAITVLLIRKLFSDDA